MTEFEQRLQGMTKEEFDFQIIEFIEKLELTRDKGSDEDMKKVISSCIDFINGFASIVR